MDSQSRFKDNLPGVQPTTELISLAATNCFADIAMVLDNSPGTTSNDWSLVKAFASSILDQIAISSNDNRVAIVTMDNGGTRWADLDDYRTGPDIQGVINAIPSARSGVRVSDGLRAARQQVFTSFSGDRSNVQNVVIILSRNRDSGDTNGEANALKQQGTAIVAIGLRNIVDENLLRFIVSGDQSNYVSIGSLQELPSVLQTVIQKACAARQNPVVTPAPTAAPTAAPTPAPNPSQSTPYGNNAVVSYGVIVDSDCGGLLLPTFTECKSDIVFVIDDSGSIRDANIVGQPDNWQTVKDFIVGVVDQLNVGWVETRVGAVTFSNEGIKQFELDDYWELPFLESAINAITYNGGNTNTTGGLRVARQQLFTTAAGDRSDAANIIVLVTDGKPTREVALLPAEVNLIKSLGITIIGIGVTNQVDENQMRSIVTAPDSINYIYVNDFNLLPSIVQQVTSSSCAVAAPTQPPLLANCVADVAFVIDDSGSIRDANIVGQADNWESVTNFMSRIVSRLTIGLNNVRIGAVTFSNDGILMFDLDDYNNAVSVETALKNLDYTGGNTNTTGGLRVARTRVFNQVTGGDRSSVPNIMIVITDGKPTREVNTLWDEVAIIKNSGISIVGVGVTNQVDVSTMERLVTRPSSRYYHQVDDFSDLDTIVDIVTRDTCQVIQSNSVPAASATVLPPVEY